MGLNKVSLRIWSNSFFVINNKGIKVKLCLKIWQSLKKIYTFGMTKVYNFFSEPFFVNFRQHNKKYLKKWIIVSFFYKCRWPQIILNVIYFIYIYFKKVCRYLILLIKISLNLEFKIIWIFFWKTLKRVRTVLS